MIISTLVVHIWIVPIAFNLYLNLNDFLMIIFLKNNQIFWVSSSPTWGCSWSLCGGQCSLWAAHVADSSSSIPPFVRSKLDSHEPTALLCSVSFTREPASVFTVFIVFIQWTKFGIIYFLVAIPSLVGLVMARKSPLTITNFSHFNLSWEQVLAKV